MPASRYVDLPGGEPYVHPDAEKKHETRADRPLEITLGVRRKKNLPRDLSEFDSIPPTQRRYLTHEELETIYGSDPDAVARIKELAAEHDLTVINKPAAQLRLAGTVGSLTRAFHVELYDHYHRSLGQFHAHTKNIQVPRHLVNDITGAFGFNTQRRLRRPHILNAPNWPASLPAAGSGFWPAQLGKIYRFPNVKRQTETIALLEFGGGVKRKDLKAYFHKTRAAPPELRIIRVHRIPVEQRKDKSMIGEVMIDIEVVGALCPGARIAVYFSTFDEKGMIDALSAVISDTANKPSVVSISWGYSENQRPPTSRYRWSPSVIDHMNRSFLAAALLGITVCAAAGDNGSEAAISDRRAHVWFPATSPYVLAVGGTTLRVRNGAGRRHVKEEIVWNSGGGWATGGGVSDVTRRPVWQKHIKAKSINPGHFAGRAIPDVAANADRHTGYWAMVNGKLGIHGGTSAAAPLWASLIARLNCRLGARVGNFNALLYGTYGPAHTLRDIEVGNNDVSGTLRGQFAAAKGWDPASGWGAPDGRKLLAALQQPRKTSRQP